MERSNGTLSGHKGNGGLQGSSLGPLYPWTVRGKGMVNGKGTLQAFNLLTEHEGIQHEYDLNIPGSFEYAHKQAEQACRVLQDKTRFQALFGYGKQR